MTEQILLPAGSVEEALVESECVTHMHAVAGPSSGDKPDSSGQKGNRNESVIPLETSSFGQTNDRWPPWDLNFNAAITITI